jgi:transcriptional regulator NrdR family protein
LNCPNCGHPESRVAETRAKPDGDRRVRICRDCGKTFRTMETVAVYAGRSIGYLVAATAADEEEDAA